MRAFARRMSDPVPPDHRLFVYGTLAPGRPNAHVLAPLGGTWQRGTVRGQLLPDGWGAAAGYPALVPDISGEEVAGLLFTAAELPAHWARIDAFEGPGYVRVPIAVVLEDGTSVEAFVYALSGR